MNAHYTFDEGSGGSLGDSAGDVNGDLSTAGWSSKGKKGGCLQFDGTSAYAEIPHNESLMPEHITVSIWISPSNYDNNFVRVLEKGGYKVGGGYSLEFNPSMNKKIKFVIWDDDKFNGAESDDEIPLNKWTHVAGTFDGSTVRVYINGQVQLKYNSASMSPNNASLMIGRANHGLNSFFPGKIDDLRIYNRNLTDDEIASIGGQSSGGSGFAGPAMEGPIALCWTALVILVVLTVVLAGFFAMKIPKNKGFIGGVVATLIIGAILFTPSLLLLLFNDTWAELLSTLRMVIYGIIGIIIFLFALAAIGGAMGKASKSGTWTPSKIKPMKPGPGRDGVATMTRSRETVFGQDRWVTRWRRP